MGERFMYKAMRISSGVGISCRPNRFLALEIIYALEDENGRERLHTEEELEAFDRERLIYTIDPDGNEYWLTTQEIDNLNRGAVTTFLIVRPDRCVWLSSGTSHNDT